MITHVWLFVTPWTIARQAPLSKEFSRQEYWSVGCHFLFHLPDPGIKPTCLASPALAGRSFTTALPGSWGYCVLLIWSAWLPWCHWAPLAPSSCLLGKVKGFLQDGPHLGLLSEEKNLWPVKMRSTSQAGHLRPDHASGEWRALPWCSPSCGRIPLPRPAVALSDGGHSQASGENEVSWTEHLMWWNLPCWSCLPASVSLCKGTELHPQWQKECLGCMSI